MGQVSLWHAVACCGMLWHAVAAGPHRLLWGYDISAKGMFQADVNRMELEITRATGFDRL